MGQKIEGTFFGSSYHPIVFFSRFSRVHWGYGVLTTNCSPPVAEAMATSSKGSTRRCTEKKRLDELRCGVRTWRFPFAVFVRGPPGEGRKEVQKEGKRAEGKKDFDCVKLEAIRMAK